MMNKVDNVPLRALGAMRKFGGSALMGENGKFIARGKVLPFDPSIWLGLLSRGFIRYDGPDSYVLTHWGTQTLEDEDKRDQADAGKATKAAGMQ